MLALLLLLLVSLARQEPLLLLLLVSLARQEQDYRCIPGGPGLGVSLPRGDSFLRQEGPGLQLQCLLAPSSSLMAPSSSLLAPSSSLLVPSSSLLAPSSIPPRSPTSSLQGGPSLSFRFNGTRVSGGSEGQGAIETTFLPSTPGVTEVHSTIRVILIFEGSTLRNLFLLTVIGFFWLKKTRYYTIYF